MNSILKITKKLITIAALAIISASAAGQTAYDGFSAAAQTNANGGQIYTNLQYAIIPSSLTGPPVVKFLNARFSGSDTSNALARVSLYVSTPSDLSATKIVTATSAATNVTVDAAFTNGVLAGDLIVQWKKATDSYVRIRVAGPSVTLTGLSTFETVTTAAGDRLFKMVRSLHVPAALPTLVGSTLAPYRDVTLSGDLVVGPPGRPILCEAFGTNAPVLTTVTALPLK